MNNANGGNIIFKFLGDDSDLKKTTNSVGNMTKSLLVATGVTKALSTGFNMITGSMDKAISRYDTMNNFPRVMSNLGISSEDAEKSINRMSEALNGLPTTLDQGAMAVQRFTSANGDIEKSTDIFLAVNSAILAGGASTEIQASALEQLSQAYAKGKPDMMEWRTLMTAMPAQLNQVAKAMGYVNASDLGEVVRGDGGAEEFNRMIETMISLSGEFETQAKGATGGIGTAITNMKTRIATGVSEMIASVDKGLAENGIGSIAQILANIGSTIRDALISLSPYIIEVVSLLAEWLPPILSFLKEFAPIILTIVGAFMAYEKTVQAIQLATKVWAVAQAILNGTMLLNPIGLIVAGIVALIAMIVLLWNKCEWFRDLVLGAWELIKAGFNIAVQYITQKIENIKNTIKTIIEVGKSIIIWFQELPGKVVEVGTNIVKGIGRGITNGFGWLKDKIKAFVGNVTDFIKKIFKIGSPSKLMEDKIGQWIPKGIGVGIVANTDAVKDSMEKLQNVALDSFNISPALASSLHYSPNIIVNNNIEEKTDPLGQTVMKIKTFAGGAKNDYNYGMGV